MIPYIIAGILVASGVLVAVVAMQPSEFRVSRSMAMNAPPEKVFVLVDTMKSWEEWSPFAELDPAMKMKYEGPAEGVGSSYSWEGNNKAGVGRSTIVASEPHKRVQFKLEFLRPFKATNDVVFTFEPKGDSTVVTWSMSGKNGFMGKAMGLFMNCDKMIGDMFDKGLAKMKTLAESGERV
jgi:uncharacterized protein YndB with AHSA1/START domain